MNWRREWRRKGRRRREASAFSYGSHQHPQSNHGELKRLALICGFPQKSNLWILVEAWRSLARGDSIMCE
jgi:hypothetical protein